MPKLRQVGLDFFAAPPAEIRNEKRLPCSAAHAFAILSDTPSWALWFDDMKSGQWTSAAPYGVGSTRHMKLGVTAVDERILAWEPGRRFSFALTTMGAPLVRAMAEDWRLEAQGESACTLTHHVAYEPTLLTRALHPIVRGVFGRQFRKTLENLAVYVTKH